MPENPAEIAVAVAAAGSPQEDWPGVTKATLVSLCALGVVYFEHSAWKHALGVMALIGSPAPLRALIAPILARVLKTAAKEIAP